MPSSLTRDHSSTFVSSTCPPVSVCGTGTRVPPCAGLSCLFRPRALAVRVAPPTRPRLSVNDGSVTSRLPTSFNGARLAAAPATQLPTHVKRSIRGTGLSPRCPSGSACAYPLGPTNPPRITRAAEPLGFRWWGFAPHFSVTRSGIRTRLASTAGFRCRFAGQATLPYHPDQTVRILSVGGGLCPVGFSAHPHSTSELLRTLSRVAASKPTSWLSAHGHNLSHSAHTWGP